MTEIKKPKIEFAPGCFDNFEGTQEELDELVAEIHQIFESGDYLKNMVPLTDLDEDEIDGLLEEMPDDTPRTLQ